MSACVLLEVSQGLGRVTLSHPGKFNAMSRAMWLELRSVFESIQQNPQIRCVLVAGEGGHFCAGGDISEYADFRFAEDSLRHFHDNEVWGGLQAMLDCDVPMVALIEGNCMGAGVEIASCCDIRIATHAARFGAPIARLGFPMAPREAALVMRALGELTAREMLLAASVFDAHDMKERGFLNHLVAADEAALVVQKLLDRICQLAPAAARLNKQTFRALAPLVQAPQAAGLMAAAYQYADSAEHREGIAAFVQKRPPQF